MIFSFRDMMFNRINTHEVNRMFFRITKLQHNLVEHFLDFEGSGRLEQTGIRSTQLTFNNTAVSYPISCTIDPDHPL